MGRKCRDVIAAEERADKSGCNNAQAETTMSNPRLPPETLDHVVDHLHDTEDALKN